MYKFFIYPLNITIMFLFSILISSFELSDFYDSLTIRDIFFLIIIASLYAVQVFFLKKLVYVIDNEKNNLSDTYKPFLTVAVLGAVVEFFIVGLPIFSGGGRDDYAGIPILHVFFYAFSIIAMLYSSLYSNKKNILLCCCVVFLLSMAWLSRQLMMISFLIIIISIVLRNRNNILPWGRILFLLTGIIFLFALIGNFRQKLAGDYVEDYILKIGGANSSGEKLGDVLYWFWLYLASPIYNLMLNMNNYYDFGERCNSSIYYGSCSGDYIPSVLLPDTIVKYFSNQKFEIDLIISYLNVGTGYAEAARIMGLLGVVLQIFLHGLFFFVGYKLMPLKAKNLFIVYYSTLSIFMIFNNTFVKGELFVVFVILFLMRFKLKF